MPRSFAPALLLLFMLGLLPLGGCDRGSHPTQIGKRAPDFTVVDDMRKVHLEDFRGKVVVLNFWATWCAPCIEELPSLTAMQKALPSVALLAISTDTDPAAYRQNEDGAAYRQFLENHRLPPLTVEDHECRSNALYGTNRFPETYVIDRKGVLRRKFIGPQNWTSPEILEYLSQL